MQCSGGMASQPAASSQAKISEQSAQAAKRTGIRVRNTDTSNGVRGLRPGEGETLLLMTTPGEDGTGE